MKTIRIVLVPLLLSLASATPASAASRDRIRVVNTGGVASYWTPYRMSHATPYGARGVPRTAGMPSARVTSGSRTIGALFFDDGEGSHYCTASVIRSSKRNLLVTAAHCLYNPNTRQWHTHIAFVPRYDQGSRPYGTWPVWLMVVDRRWLSYGDEDMDIGFAAVQVMGGRRIADVVGSNQLLVDQGVSGNVLVMGYPSKENNPADHPVWCSARVRQLGRNQMRFDCRGFSGGTSGSPWIKGYDRRTQSGYVMGVIGGHEQGGAYDWRSYGSVLGGGAAELIVTANDKA